MNPDKAYDCGKPRGWIKKVGWKGGEEKWPGAYRAVRNFKITNQEMGEMVGRVDLDGKSVDEVVAAWDDREQGSLDGLDEVVCGRAVRNRSAGCRPAARARRQALANPACFLVFTLTINSNLLI